LHRIRAVVRVVAALCALDACASTSQAFPDEERPNAADDGVFDKSTVESYQQSQHPRVSEAQAVPDRPATAKEVEAVSRLCKRAEQIRGLAFLHPVEVRVQNKAAMTEYVRSQLDHEWLEHMRVRWVGLGLLKPDEAIEQEAVEKTADKLLGYYDAKKKYLAITETASYSLIYFMNMRQSTESRSVVLHELVHALQDQHFDLERELARARTSDEKNAFMALVEGDATLAMVAYSMRRYGIVMRSLIEDHAFFEQVMNGIPSTAGAAAIGPRAMQNPIVFRYSGGALFAAHLVSSDGYDALNAAFRRLPASTLEILRPELYKQHFRPVKVPVPPLAALRSAGYTVLYDDVVGQLELAAYLTTGGVAADDVASEWTGDRFVALAHGKDYAVVWAIRFADISTLQRALELALQAGRAASRGKIPFTAISHGHYLLIVRNAADAVANVVAQGFRQWIDHAERD
jgi:hypothetical protein